ncbi:MAG: SDR family NAD(P)-dependent oxidoreductase [Chthoniobacterales bacterium]
MKLSGKIALVTGSSQGIGEGIAIRLAEEGADVVINYLGNSSEADDSVAKVRAAGRRAFAVQADVSKVGDIRRMIDESVAEFGRLDLLVNNAGIEKNAPFLEATEADYDRVLAVNLKGVFFTTQMFVAHLRDEKRPGKVINISSVHEEMAFPHFASYCASKGGLRMLTRTLSVELAPLRITINNVAPGAIQTPINTALLANKPKLEALLHNIPLGRLGQPSDVAGAVVYLASSDGDYVTGSTLIVDGGLIRHYEEQ